MKIVFQPKKNLTLLSGVTVLLHKFFLIISNAFLVLIEYKENITT